jgi:hypothetical protein
MTINKKTINCHMKKLCIVVITALVSCMAFSQTTYTFTGNGNWSQASNWANSTKPPSRLPSSSSIFISPQAGDSCVLNTPHKNLPGSNMVISTGAKFIIRGGIGDYSDSADLVTRLKKITYPVIWVFPELRCGGSCPPSITRETDYYMYDSLNRLIERKVVIIDSSNWPVFIDSSRRIKYFYSNNSPQITSYTIPNRGQNGIETHFLTYDLQNRLIKDSLNSSLLSNPSYARTFRYLSDTIIQLEPKAFPSGQQYIADTLIMIGSNVVKEKIGYSNHNVQHDFIVAAYRNPYSYANNYPLIASDFRSFGSDPDFLTINNHVTTYNQCSEILVQKWNNNIAGYPYNSHFLITFDSYGRISTLVKYPIDGNYLTIGNTSFEYY